MPTIKNIGTFLHFVQAHFCILFISSAYKSLIIEVFFNKKKSLLSLSLFQ